MNPERVHPAFEQRRWPTKDVVTNVGKEVMFDVAKYSPVWFGYTSVERNPRLRYKFVSDQAHGGHKI